MSPWNSSNRLSGYIVFFARPELNAPKIVSRARRIVCRSWSAENSPTCRSRRSDSFSAICRGCRRSSASLFSCAASMSLQCRTCKTRHDLVKQLDNSIIYYIYNILVYLYPLPARIGDQLMRPIVRIVLLSLRPRCLRSRSVMPWLFSSAQHSGHT